MSADVTEGAERDRYHADHDYEHEEFDGYDDDGYDDDGFGDFDCHMGPDGYCGLAGTEECDWDCPVSRERSRRLFAARDRARQHHERNRRARTPKRAAIKAARRANVHRQQRERRIA